MKADLHYKDDSSDKEYHVELKEEATGFVVNISYGRSGGAMQEGTKTASPVNREVAEKIFNKVVDEKVAKGYVMEQTYAGQVTTKRQSRLKPMLCQKATIERAKEIAKSGEWVIEQKFDGVRAYIEDGKIFNRRGQEITKQFPEFTGVADFKMSYDGEIVAQSGIFADVSGRVHMKDKFLIGLRAKASPAKFMLFDVVGDGYQQQPLTARREVLEKTNYKNYPWITLAEQFPATDIEEKWGEVIASQQEGLVMKQKDAAYQEGKRSPDWLKVKAWEEAVATFTKFEEHPKGITIETADGRRVVVNGAQADEVKEAIKTKGSVKAEIQHLPQENENAWRFPSFRGLV